MSLKTDITDLLNRHSAENRSDTPDFILAQFLLDCLHAFDHATVERSSWYDPSIRRQGRNPDVEEQR